MTDDLVKRLRRTVLSAPDINGGRRNVPLNPDGQKAAALIIKLTCERAAFAHLSHSRGKLLLAETARAEAAERERDEAHQRYVDANEARIDAERERDEARAGNHSANDYEPTWAELTDYWKRRADAAERKVEKLREALREIEQCYGRVPWLLAKTMKETARAALKETESEG